MTQLPATIIPELWMRDVFSSRDACRGGVIKRQVREVERRGWQALENGRHFIVCCNAQPIRCVRAGPARAGA